MSSAPPPAEFPIWAFEVCPGCARYTPLAIYEFTCCCFCACCCHDHNLPLVALAWVCDHCLYVVESAGLYTSSAAAHAARRRLFRQRELDGTALWRPVRANGHS